MNPCVVHSLELNLQEVGRDPKMPQTTGILTRHFGRSDALVSPPGFGGHPLGDAVGRFELFKTTKKYDGALGRSQHGFSSPEELPA